MDSNLILLPFPPSSQRNCVAMGIRDDCHSERSEESNHSTESIVEILRLMPQNDIVTQYQRGVVGCEGEQEANDAS
jgi:hypothetical protein